MTSRFPSPYAPSSRARKPVALDLRYRADREDRAEHLHAHPGLDPDRVGGGRGQSVVRAMIPVPSGVRGRLAVGHTDMRRGMNSLALQVQEGLKRDPHAGDLYVFRGKQGHLLKILWHDGIGMS